jgi:hypothetical protein
VHPVRLLRFRATAEAAFESVPRDAAAIAMRTIGGLAARDAAAWRKVKQAKDMPRQLLLARVNPLTAASASSRRSTLPCKRDRANGRE